MVQKRKLISFFNKHLLGCELLIVEDQNGKSFCIKPCEIKNESHFEDLFGKSAVKDLLNCFLLESENSADMIEKKLAQTLAQYIKKLDIIKDLLLISQAFEHQFVKNYLSQLKEKQITIFTNQIINFQDGDEDEILKAIFLYDNKNSELMSKGLQLRISNKSFEQAIVNLASVFRILETINIPSFSRQIIDILEIDEKSQLLIRNYLFGFFDIRTILQKIAQYHNLDENAFYRYFELENEGNKLEEINETQDFVLDNINTIQLPPMKKKNLDKANQKSKLSIFSELKLSFSDPVYLEKSHIGLFNCSNEPDLIVEQILKEILDTLQEPVKRRLLALADSIEEYENCVLNTETQIKICDLTRQDIAILAHQKLHSSSMIENHGICRAIAILDRANQLATGGHRLHYVQKIAILLLMGTTQQQAVIHQTIGKYEKKGHISQIITGEGKTTIIAIIAALKVFQGEIVDVITSNELLAQTAVNDKALFYQILNISIAHNNFDGHEVEGTRACYLADIVYGSINNFQFDFISHHYLGKNTLGDKREFNQKNKKSVILDEIDSLLIDQGANIAKISTPIPGMEILRYIYINIWKELLAVETDIVKQSEQISISFEQQKNKIHEKLKSKKEKIIQNEKMAKYLHQYVNETFDIWIENAILARFTYQEDIHYKIQIKNNEKHIVLIDYLNTGTSMHNTVLSQGLHQFLQLQNNLALSYESLTSSYISNLGYIRNYENNMLGLTGTLGSFAEQNLLSFLYNLDFSIVPTHMNKNLENHGIHIISDERFIEDLAYRALYISLHQERAILFICNNIMDAKSLYQKINTIAKTISSGHTINLIKFTDEAHEYQATTKLIMPRDIIVATNIAGRGTHFSTSEELEKNGGLYEITAFLPQNQRVQDQASGRTARQGNSGTTKVFVRLSEVEHLTKTFEKHHGFEWNFATINSPDFHQYVLECRDEFEAHRLREKMVNFKVMAFHDSLAKRFGELYVLLKKEMDQLSKNSKKAKKIKFLLKDLQARWAFWLFEQHYSNEEIKLQIINEELEIEAEFKKFLDDFQVKAILGGKITFNPYYGIALAEEYLRDNQDEDALLELLNALEINEENPEDCLHPILYGAYLKLAEIAINRGNQYLYRFMKALGGFMSPILSLLIGSIESHDENYLNQAVKFIKLAEKSMENELDYFSQSIYGAMIPNSQEDIKKILSHNQSYGIKIEVLMLEEIDESLILESLDNNPLYFCIGVKNQDDTLIWVPGFFIKKNTQKQIYYLKFRNLELNRVEEKLKLSLPSVELHAYDMETEVISRDSGLLAVTNLSLMINNDDTKQLTTLFINKYLKFAKDIFIEDIRKFNLALDYPDTISSILFDNLEHSSSSVDETIENTPVELIVYDTVEQQDGDSCGPMTIQNLFVMYQQIQTFGLEQFIENFKKKNINFTTQEQVQLLRQYHHTIVQELSESNWYSDSNMQMILKHQFKDQPDIDLDKQVYESMTYDVIQDFMKHKKELQQENVPIFIAYNIGGKANQDSGIHWIAICVVNYKGKLRILYKDSKGDFNSHATFIKAEFEKHALQYLSSNIDDHALIQESKKKSNIYSSNDFIEHINSRYFALEIYIKMIRSLKETLDAARKNQVQHYGLVIDAKTYNFLGKYHESASIVEQKIFHRDIVDFRNIGLDNAYQLKKVYDVPPFLLESIKIQLLVGAELYPTFYGAPIGNAMISEGLSDLATILIDYKGQEVLKWEDYVWDKLTSYSISLLAMGLNKIGYFGKLFKAVSFAGKTTSKLLMSTARGIAISIVTEKALNFIFMKSLQGMKPIIEENVKDIVNKKFSLEKNDLILSKINTSILTNEINHIFNTTTKQKLLKAGHDIGFGAIKRVGNWKVELAAIALETCLESYFIYQYTHYICDELLISLEKLTGEVKVAHRPDLENQDFTYLKAQISSMIYQRIVSLLSKVTNTLLTIFYTRYQENKNKQLEHNKRLVSEANKKAIGKKCAIEVLANFLGIDFEQIAVLMGLASENGSNIRDMENALKRAGHKNIVTQKITLNCEKIKDFMRIKNSDQCILSLNRNKGQLGHTVLVRNNEHGIPHVIENGKSIPLTNYINRSQHEFIGARVTGVQGANKNSYAKHQARAIQIAKNKSEQRLLLVGQNEGEKFGAPLVKEGSKGFEMICHQVGPDLKIIVSADDSKLQKAILLRDASNAILQGLYDNENIKAGMVQTLIEMNNNKDILRIAIFTSGESMIQPETVAKYKESLRAQFKRDQLRCFNKEKVNNLIENIQTMEQPYKRANKKHSCALDNSFPTILEMHKRGSLIVGGEFPLTKSIKNDYGSPSHSCDPCHQATESLFGREVSKSGYKNKSGGRKDTFIHSSHFFSKNNSQTKVEVEQKARGKM